MLASILAAVMSSCDSFMIVGSALFTRNLYQRYFVRNPDEKYYLRVSRIASVGIVAGGIFLTFAFGSVAQILKFFWVVTGLVGISFWGGVLWRRANRYGAWASIVAGGIVLLVTSEYTLVNQIAWYLSAGIGSLVVVSLLTRPESKEMLDRFYTVLYTPVGQEHKLREAGISVVLE